MDLISYEQMINKIDNGLTIEPNLTASCICGKHKPTPLMCFNCTEREFKHWMYLMPVCEVCYQYFIDIGMVIDKTNEDNTNNKTN